MNRQIARVSLAIYCGDRSRNVAIGETVDFDEVLVPARGDRAALTLGEVVRPEHFEPEAVTAKKTAPRLAPSEESSS